MPLLKGMTKTEVSSEGLGVRLTEIAKVDGQKIIRQATEIITPRIKKNLTVAVD
jgi:hypothetical protein